MVLKRYTQHWHFGEPTIRQLHYHLQLNRSGKQQQRTGKSWTIPLASPFFSFLQKKIWHVGNRGPHWTKKKSFSWNRQEKDMPYRNSTSLPEEMTKTDLIKFHIKKKEHITLQCIMTQPHAMHQVTADCTAICPWSLQLKALAANPAVKPATAIPWHIPACHQQSWQVLHIA